LSGRPFISSIILLSPKLNANYSYSLTQVLASSNLSLVKAFAGKGIMNPKSLTD